MIWDAAMSDARDLGQPAASWQSLSAGALIVWISGLSA